MTITELTEANLEKLAASWVLRFRELKSHDRALIKLSNFASGTCLIQVFTTGIILKPTNCNNIPKDVLLVKAGTPLSLDNWYAIKDVSKFWLCILSERNGYSCTLVVDEGRGDTGETSLRLILRKALIGCTLFIILSYLIVWLLD